MPNYIWTIIIFVVHKILIILERKIIKKSTYRVVCMFNSFFWHIIYSFRTQKDTSSKKKKKKTEESALLLNYLLMCGPLVEQVLNPPTHHSWWTSLAAAFLLWLYSTVFGPLFAAILRAELFQCDIHCDLSLIPAFFRWLHALDY